MKKPSLRREPLDEGEDPDFRFSLANERTFLAWVRTSIAIMVAGLAVAQFFKSRAETTRLAIALPLLILAAVVAFNSFGSWEEKERAMRLSRPLPASSLPRILGLATGLIALLATILTITDRVSRPPLPEDAGLAVERTFMAWGRTVLGMIALAVLLVRFGIVEHVMGVAFPVAAVAVLAGGAGWWHSREALVVQRVLVERRWLRAFAAGAALAAVGTAATVLWALG